MKTTKRADYTEQFTTVMPKGPVVEDLLHLNDISFVITSSGKLDICFVQGSAAVQNVVEAVVNTCRGELQMDKTAGIPYFESVFGRKSVDLTEWSGYMQNAISNTNGVKGILGFSYSTQKSANNRMGIAYEATIKTEYGTTSVGNAN